MQPYARHDTVTPPGEQYHGLIKVEPKVSSSLVAASGSHQTQLSYHTYTNGQKYSSQEAPTGKVMADMTNPYAPATPGAAGATSAGGGASKGYSEWQEVNRSQQGTSYAQYSNSSMPPPPPAHSNPTQHGPYVPTYNGWENGQSYTVPQQFSYPVQGRFLWYFILVFFCSQRCSTSMSKGLSSVTERF